MRRVSQPIGKTQTSVVASSNSASTSVRGKPGAKFWIFSRVAPDKVATAEDCVLPFDRNHVMYRNSTTHPSASSFDQESIFLKDIGSLLSEAILTHGSRARAW